MSVEQEVIEFALFWQRMEHAHPCMVIVHMEDIWTIMACIQLTWRQPHVGDELKCRLRHLGESLERCFQHDPYGRVVAARGWDLSQDLVMGEWKEGETSGKH